MKKFMLLLLFVGVVNADSGVALDFDKASANCKSKGFEQSTRQYWDCVDTQRKIPEKVQPRDRTEEQNKLNEKLKEDAVKAQIRQIQRENMRRR